MSLPGIIVVRDVPKEEAQIDLWSFAIKGGFRGWQLVPPGPHHVAVRAGNRTPGFWCFVEPGRVVVRILNADHQQFVTDEPGAESQYSALATSGAMSKALAVYPMSGWAEWCALTKHLTATDFPPGLNEETPDPWPLTPPAGPAALPRSRLDLALYGSHGGDGQALLAEFEFAFLRWLLAGDEPDEEAAARWRHLLLAFYNAGDRRIVEAPDLFAELVDTLLAQLPRLPHSWLSPGTVVTAQAGYLVEDLIDSGVPGLAEKGRELAAYLVMPRGGGG